MGPIRQGPEEDILFTRFALNVCIYVCHLQVRRICILNGKSQIGYLTVALSQSSKEGSLVIESSNNEVMK